MSTLGHKLYVKEDIMPLLSFSQLLIASALICAAAFDFISCQGHNLKCSNETSDSLQVDCPSQLCMAAVHRLWIQPAYYQCMPDCVNLMAGSWQGDTRLRVVSSVQLAEGSYGHYPTVSPPIRTVLHHGYWWVSARGWTTGTDLRDHVDTTHDPLRAGDGMPFLLKQPSHLAEVGIFLAAWVSPAEVLPWLWTHRAGSVGK